MRELMTKKEFEEQKYELGTLYYKHEVKDVGNTFNISQAFYQLKKVEDRGKCVLLRYKKYE